MNNKPENKSVEYLKAVDEAKDNSRTRQIYFCARRVISGVLCYASYFLGVEREVEMPCYLCELIHFIVRIPCYTSVGIL